MVVSRLRRAIVSASLIGLVGIVSVHGEGAYDLSGAWEGVIASRTPSMQDGDEAIVRLDLRGGQGSFSGSMTLMLGLTVPEQEAALRGAMPQGRERGYMRRFVCEQDAAVSVSGETITIAGSRTRSLYCGEIIPGDLPKIALRGRMCRPDLMFGETDRDAVFWLERRPAPPSAYPPEPARSAAVKIVSSIFPGLEYACYVPKSYDPSAGARVVLLALPGGDARPLSPAEAEALGWISIGLPKSRPDLHQAIVDVKSRFNIVRGGICLAGFSRTGGEADRYAKSLGLHCGGVVCAGNWGGYAVQAGIPCFYVFGDKDLLPAAMPIESGGRQYRDFRLYFEERIKPKSGNVAELRIFPGGHAWGPPALHAEALRWLDSFGK